MDAITRMISFYANREVTLLLCLCFLSSRRTSPIECFMLCHYIIDTDGHMCTYLACSIFSRCMWKHTVRWECMPQFDILNIVHGCSTEHMQHWLNKPSTPVQDDGFPSTLLILIAVLTIRNATIPYAFAPCSQLSSAYILVESGFVLRNLEPTA